MIKVETITIEEFRGIRKLTLNLGGKNFAVCGPNGTGKSGLVDALEFGLTGNVSRLSGKGRGALSVKSHGPHVDVRDHPERAKVTLDITIPSLNKKARIVRTAKNPAAPVITPSDPDILAALKQVEAHPEFVLSRREIIKYVLAEPGERSKEVQALLQLDELETVRATLLKISNATEKELKPLEQARNDARDALLRALAVNEPIEAAILGAANTKRAVLSLPALTKLEATTSIRDGIESLAAAAPSAIVKAAAAADLNAASTLLTQCKAADFITELETATAALTKLRENEENLTGIARDALLKSALELFDDAKCPVCETAWEAETFKAVVASQRERLAAAVAERKAVEAQLNPIMAKFATLASAMDTVAGHCSKFPQQIDPKPLVDFKTRLRSAASQGAKLLPVDDTVAALTLGDTAGVVVTLSIVETVLAAIPEPTERDAARDFLFVGQERLEAYRGAANKHAAGRRRATVAKKAFEIYGTTTTKALETIYQKVESEFRAFYRAINNDDESTFEAQLSPSIGKLGFEVNFYGRGFFPPGAYHSEGHQDGMGLCLYLALMKYLLGSGFTFAVLDDVLMSVDTGHRREVCALLKSAFPETQFVLTTHDGVWLRHMKSVGLITNKSGIEFRKWTVDHGPSEWKDIDIWAEIDANVEKNEIRAAAGLLRHSLEHLSAEYCGRLGARVEYKGDGRYELGDLLPSAIGAMRTLVKEGKAAANSWGNPEAVAALAERDSQFSAAATAASVEQWQINPVVHYNEWANLSKADFAPVVSGFKTLTKAFGCAGCGGMLYLVKQGHQNNMLRCDCSAVSIGLVPKK
jgi:recombinational DNA repair ATPase RecF